ncbi:fibronectin type III domain-containing protein [Olleya namhaensis]|uniref:fibronectin type III domain-containing protein n=1 Tax=Olleya namhaensis TaxID=1144750 RepID=UPI00249366F5|nr:gliding motility-associated C-terminal domain-containing protein [Olleya namhaensis]
MKKTTFILALLLFSIGWQANSQIYLQEGFDTSIPTTWTVTDAGDATGDSWISGQQGAGNSLNGTNAALVDSDAAGSGTLLIETLTSPVFDSSSASALFLDFDQFFNNIGSDSAVVEVWDGAAWVAILTQTADVGGFNAPDQQHIDITAYANSAMQVRFIYDDANSWAWYWLIDNIAIYNATCPNPSGLIVDSFTSDSVEVSWTIGGTETAWEIAVQPVGTGIPAGSGTQTTINSGYTDSTLLPATDYEVYVRADCGGDASIWTGPITFTTACAVFTPDYLQDFTTIPPNCWDVADSGDATTGPGDIGTSSWTQDGYLNNGTTGAYKINLWVATKSDWLLSPLFDLTGVPFQVEFDFGVMPFGGSTVAGTLGSDDTVELMITTDSGTTWTVLQTFDASSVIPDSGLHVVQDLSAYSGATAQFGIRASEGTIDDAPDNDVFVDNFQVRAIPSCPDPLAIAAVVTGDTTADITWDAGSTETEWQIWIQAAGTGVPTTDGVVTSLNTPYPVTGLTPSTAYEVYVRGNCGTEGFSTWIGPVNFTTFNTPPPVPVGVTCATGTSTFIFTEDFGNDTNYVPSGWTGTTFSDLDGNWDITTANGNSGGTGPNITWDGNAGTHLEYEGSGNTTNVASAITPAIDLSAAVDGAELSFWMHAFGDNMGTLNIGVSTSATGPFTSEYTWIGDYQSTADEAWVPIGVNLDAYLGQVIYIEISYVGTGETFESDMSIDQIRVEACGTFCVAPSGLTATSITESTADISWTPSGTETEWNYVVQLAGTGVPTSGTTTTTTTISETGLNAATDYEVYVQAVCGTDSSTWAGPFNFSTVLQFDFVLDCATDGPQTISYCYENSDTNIFTFSSTDGTPLNITFTAGQVESGWDELVVFDTDGVTDLNTATPYGNGGDVSGITYQSSGDTISFGVQSDGVFDCSSQGYTSLSVTVTCATCINPAATFVVVDDCANGDQFLVDVDVTSLGDATSLEIEDNQGGGPVTITAASVSQFGPYAFNTDVVFTVSNVDDANCVITSSAISLAACPPANDNPCNATVALVNNGESCIDVNSGTLVEATDSGVPAGSCATGTDDDVWYQFTALGEQQIIQILNVAGGFNVDHALYEEGADCNDLTQLYCTPDDSSITPTLTVGNVYYIRVFSAGTTATTITFDLCIQTLGVPTYCTEALPICADPTIFYPSIVGDQVAPSYIDYDCLGSQPDPQWNTIQFDDAGDYVFQLAQTNDAGTGLDIDFIVWGPFPGQDAGCFELLPEAIADCSYSATATETITLTGVPANSIYIILITNFSQQSGTYVFTQESGPLDGTNCDVVCEVALDYDGILIEQGVTAAEGSSDPINLCGNDSVTLTADTAYAVDSYDWYVNGIYQDGINAPTFVATETGTYQCVVGGGICDDFTFSILATINFYDAATADQALDMEVCDDGAGNGVFDLETQTATILGTQDPSGFSVTYYSALSDAQAGTSALTSPYTAIDGTTIYVRVEDVDAVGSNSGCASTNTTFNLVVSTSPEATQPMDMEVCDDGTGSNVFDLTADEATTIGAQTSVLVTYHTTEADALSGDSAIATPTTYTLTANSETIYVRVENATASDCFATTSFGISYNPAPETTFSTDMAFEVCPNATSPITITADAVNYTLSEVSIKWYYEGGEITGQTGVELPTVLLAGDYEIEVTFNDSGCTSSAFVTVDELETCIIPQGISPNGDGINDRFDLSSFDVQSLEIYNRNGTLVYSKNNYTSEWGGQADNGDMLPVGTYYYVMKYQGTKTKAAWVYINK